MGDSFLHFAGMQSPQYLRAIRSPPSISVQSQYSGNCIPRVLRIIYRNILGMQFPVPSTNSVRHWEDMNSYDLGCKTCLWEAFFIRLRHKTLLFLGGITRFGALFGMFSTLASLSFISEVV